jgi:hypothetical protein
VSVPACCSTELIEAYDFGTSCTPIQLIDLSLEDLDWACCVQSVEFHMLLSWYSQLVYDLLITCMKRISG